VHVLGLISQDQRANEVFIDIIERLLVSIAADVCSITEQLSLFKIVFWGFFSYIIGLFFWFMQLWVSFQFHWIRSANLLLTPALQWSIDWNYVLFYSTKTSEHAFKTLRDRRTHIWSHQERWDCIAEFILCLHHIFTLMPQPFCDWFPLRPVLHRC